MNQTIAPTLYHVLLLLLSFTPLIALQQNKQLFSLTTERNNNDIVFHLHANITSGDSIYADSLKVFVDHPAILLSEWSASEQPIHRYDHQFRETKQIYNKPFTLLSHAPIVPLPADTDVHIHVSYYQQSRGLFAHELLKVNINEINQLAPGALDTQTFPSKKQVPPQTEQQSSAAKQAKELSLSSYLSELFVTTDSIWVRLVLCLFLGLLLSLTPCIYPMIPITIGILQAQRKSSFLHNFLLAISYTTGMSSTFALLGLFAAMTGQLFGNIMTKPAIVIAIIVLIVYLSFSMMGFYELHVPSFLQSRGIDRQGGSLISAFLFGAASGTVASPCLSPGLLLLLTVVSTLHNYLLGFLLLFSFGIGLSIPLLLIGTFSHSLHLLPSAGQWMVEIKRLLGLAMLATCIYFLKGIVTMYTLWWILCISGLIAGGLAFYFAYTARHTWRLIHQIVGIACIALSIFCALQAIQKKYATCESNNTIEWHYDYDEAINKARTENKKLFIYFTAPFCSLCTTIERCILSHPDVMQQLSSFVLFKCDVSDESSELVASLRKKYTIVGVPVYLLINVVTDEVVGRWGSELYDQGSSYFTNELSYHL